MFLAEKAEIDELNEKVTFIERQKNELVETVLQMQQMIESLERRNGDLIDIVASFSFNGRKLVCRAGICTWKANKGKK